MEDAGALAARRHVGTEPCRRLEEREGVVELLLAVVLSVVLSTIDRYRDRMKRALAATGADDSDES